MVLARSRRVSIRRVGRESVNRRHRRRRQLASVARDMYVRRLPFPPPSLRMHCAKLSLLYMVALCTPPSCDASLYAPSSATVPLRQSQHSTPKSKETCASEHLRDDDRGWAVGGMGRRGEVELDRSRKAPAGKRAKSATSWARETADSIKSRVTMSNISVHKHRYVLPSPWARLTLPFVHIPCTPSPMHLLLHSAPSVSALDSAGTGLHLQISVPVRAHAPRYRCNDDWVGWGVDFPPSLFPTTQFLQSRASYPCWRSDNIAVGRFLSLHSACVRGWNA
jgi:hypothetical protein